MLAVCVAHLDEFMCCLLFALHILMNPFVSLHVLNKCLHQILTSLAENDSQWLDTFLGNANVGS